MTDLSYFFNGMLETGFFLTLLIGVIGGGLFGCFLATRSASARRRAFAVTGVFIALVAIGVGLYAIKSRRDHTV